MSDSREGDDIGGAIKDFIKRRREEEARAAEAANEENEQPPPAPEPQQRSHVTVNYKASHIEFEISNAFPTVIKRGFGIVSGIVELYRRNTTYTETEDNTFEPPLVVGTYNMTIRGAEVPTDDSSSEKETEEERSDK